MVVRPAPFSGCSMVIRCFVPTRRPALLALAVLALLGLAAAAACAPPAPEPPQGFDLTFRHGDLGTRLGPRFLPAPVIVPLEPSGRTDLADGDLLEGFLRLGPRLEAAEAGFPLVLGRAGEGPGWEVLFVEMAGETGEEMVRLEPTAGHLGEQPVFRLDLRVAHREPGGARDERYVAELVVPSGEAPPESLTVYGFADRLARVTVDGLALTVLLADGNSDAVYGLEDPWMVLEDAGLLAAPFTRETAREVGDFAWAGGRAWRLDLEGTAGLSGRLIPHEPELTEEEDGRARGSWAADRSAPRAAEPLACPAAEEGGSGPAGMPRLILFDLPSSAQCRAMRDLVLTAEAVARAGEGVACQRVDVKASPGALLEYGLSGAPAGVLLDAEGEEVARFEGYRGVTELAALLRKAAR